MKLNQMCTPSYQNHLRTLFILFMKSNFFLQIRNTSEVIEAQLSNVVKNVNFTEVDVIFVKSPIGQIENATGIYVHHFQHLFHLTDYQNLNQDILNIISPKLQFLESEEEVDAYFSEDKLSSLVLLPKEYAQRDLIVSEIEKLIRDGSLEEAQLNSIKGYHKNYKNFSAPTLLLYKGKGLFEQYEYNLTYTDQIVDFFYLESLNLVNRLSEDNFARVFGGAIQTQVHLLIENDLTDQLYNDYLAVALNNKENDLKYQRLIFTFSTFSENPSLWELFDFTNQTDKPKLVITETNFRKYQLQKYICQQQVLTKETIQQFIDNFRNKNLTEFYKSEPIPSNNNGILKIVGNTFSQEVLNKGKNVLVLFWDSKNSEMFQDHFSLLSELEKISNKEKLKIGHLDLALNEHPKITIDSVPKLLLYLAADKKSPKEYLRSSNLVINELKNWLDYYLGQGEAYTEQYNKDL